MTKLRVLLVQIALLVFLVFAPPGVAQESADPQPLTLATWSEIRGSVIAFAVELYDAEGARREFTWVDDPSLVASFVEAMPAEGIENATVMRVPLQPAYVHTSDGRLFQFNLVGVEQGALGTAMLANGVIPLAVVLDPIIARGYGLEEFSSSNNVFQRLSVEIAAAVFPTAAIPLNLAHLTTTRGVVKPIDVVVYAPDLKRWAEANIRGRTDALAIQVQSPSLTTADLNKLKTDGFCAKNLTFAIHGWPGTIVLGPLRSPPTAYVSDAAWGTQPGVFGDGIKDSLCPGGVVRLVSCDVAEGVAGKAFLRDFASGVNAPVFAYDLEIIYGESRRDPRTPMTVTKGALWKAVPGASAPTQITPRSTTLREIQLFQ